MPDLRVRVCDQRVWVCVISVCVCVCGGIAGMTVCVCACSESFAKSWDEDEEDWMYTNAVLGTIHNPAVPDGSADQETIFHKYCYEAVTANSKHITVEHLIPGTPQAPKAEKEAASGGAAEGTGLEPAAKRSLEVRRMMLQACGSVCVWLTMFHVCCSVGRRRRQRRRHQADKNGVRAASDWRRHAIAATTDA